MFLISAHQTYLNNKLLRERLYSCNNLKRPSSTKTSSNKDRQVYASQVVVGLNNNKHHLPEQPIDIGGRHMQSEVEQSTRLMQRTRKYFASSGHKFLFNNT